jgi:cell wall-associated NlpC family hydrolase
MLTPDLILAEARRWIGTPYAHQASLRGVGCDCLGLVRGVYAALVGPCPPVPPYAPDWAEAGGGEPLLEAAERWLVRVDEAVIASEAKQSRSDRTESWIASSGSALLAMTESGICPGDVLLFRYRPHLPAKHLAIAAGPDRMIHAYDGAAVAETAIGPWWRRRIAGVFAFPGVPR